MKAFQDVGFHLADTLGKLMYYKLSLRSVSAYINDRHDDLYYKIRMSLEWILYH